jgi:hypothetical protein
MLFDDKEMLVVAIALTGSQVSAAQRNGPFRGAAAERGEDATGITRSARGQERAGSHPFDNRR